MKAPRPSSAQSSLSTYWWVGLGSLLVGLLVWEVLARANDLPAFILPTPARVAERFLQTLLDGSLARHTAITLLEVFLGLSVGLAAGAVLGYLTAKSPTLERWLTPYIVASQAVPIAAIAPLLVIWLGVGLISKVVTCALIVFFPILVNTLTGLRTVDAQLRELLESYNANRWQTFVKLEVPAALPVLLGGLKVGATLAVIGAVVGEFVGADRGLGFLISAGRGAYDTALVFVAVGALVVLAVSL
ncbi:MAG: ABC transporter permease, partial [Anaerolineales bacterium]|nr:ABC transporter permease [Anaerolineales bacterium]